MCGRAAREELIQHIGLAPISSVTDGKDHYHRWLATCFTTAGDIGDWLVRQGHIAAEAAARSARRGLWAGAFVPPWVCRARSQ
jgi:endonuclease YncB( thermonuclease family)